MKTYPIPPEKWAETPIVRGLNPLTGLIEGDDSGYRKVRTLPENSSPLVVPAGIEIRASYDGTDEYGKYRPEIALPGGLRDGVLVVRETFARDLEDANQLLRKVFGGEYRLVALDGFRSWVRQAAGFTRLLKQRMERDSLTEDDVESFINAGNAADGTFSWVNADVLSPQYEVLTSELYKDEKFMKQLREYEAVSGDTDPMYTYVTVSANSGLGRAANRSIPLVFENNAHAGGGACDVFLLDRKGLPLNHIPFDYPGEAAGMDYLENDAHFEQYKAKAAQDELIRNHLMALGLTPETFTWSDWERFRAAIRVVYHLCKAKGWTFYSSDHGGENWHLEGGNKCYSIEASVPFSYEIETARSFPDSGNPGHALQLHGRGATAVWGGASGHRVAKKFGLEI